MRHDAWRCGDLHDVPVIALRHGRVGDGSDDEVNQHESCDAWQSSREHALAVSPLCCRQLRPSPSRPAPAASVSFCLDMVRGLLASLDASDSDSDTPASKPSKPIAKKGAAKKASSSSSAAGRAAPAPSSSPQLSGYESDNL